MNRPEAPAMQTANQNPGHPALRKDATGDSRVWSVASVTITMDATAARPATWVAVSTDNSRCSAPAVDQKIDDSTIST